MATENSSTEKTAVTTKKPYEKPSFRYEQVFVKGHDGLRLAVFEYFEVVPG